MQSQRADHQRRACAGAACVAWICAAVAGCQSFYGPPLGSGASPFSPPPPVVVPRTVAPVAVAPPVVAVPAVEGVQPVLTGPVAGPAAVPTPSGTVPPRVLPPRLLPPQYSWVLTLTPSRIVAPVGSEVVLLAGLRDGGGQPLANERIEWLLSPDSVGQLLAVGNEGNYFSLKSHPATGKISNQYAIGSTSSYLITLPRRGATPGESVRVAPGQAWVSVSSPTDGTSHVTAFAPGVLGLDRRQQIATIYWVDSQFSFPAPAIGPVGSRQRLTTVVTRQSDGSPVENGLVRYEIVGGPAAGLAPAGAGALEVPTDAQGRASVEIFQPQPVGGTNQIDVQVIRPAVPGTANRRLVIGHGGTTVTWTPPANVGAPANVEAPANIEASALEIRITGPETATVGQDVTFHIAAINRGNAPVTKLVISDSFDPGLQHAVSSSPIERDLGTLAAGQTRDNLDVTFRVTRPGRLCQRVELRGDAVRPAQAEACLTAGAPAAAAPAPGLEIRQSGPRQAVGGESVLLSILISNTGNTTLQHVKIVDTFERGLKPTAVSRGFTVEDGQFTWHYDNLAPGEKRQLQVQAVAQPGTPRACARATVTADPNLVRADEACVEISQPAGSAPSRGSAPSTGSQPIAPPLRGAPAGAAPPLAPPPSGPVPPSAMSPSAGEPPLRPGVDAPAAAAPDLAPPATAGDTVGLSVEAASLQETVTVGHKVTFEVRIKNNRDTADHQVVLMVSVPPGMSPLATASGIVAPAASTINGQIIRFAPVAEVRPGEALTYRIPVLANRAGTKLRLQVQVTSQIEQRPIAAWAETSVYDERQSP